MENSSFSVKENAGKSFKTFVLTLSVSLIIFSVVYYVMSVNSSNQESFDNSLSDNVVEKEVKGVEQKSVFNEIASKDPGVQAKEVLAGSTVATTAEVQQTTQSAADLQTGTFSITAGLFIALIIFLSTLVFVLNNPRKLALSSFEKNALRDVEEK
ncbi:hypothetical protein GYA37_02805 [candidate division WWE3 bacterium]|uniref:Uncharacterized protein n=1 Tax=candidate division WWE3 bacterium TaxID=2053526 RepID=A0A7X9E7K1_UNCKA|nr:hypothetical protein [candidate division WWE3 bacterium]